MRRARRSLGDAPRCETARHADPTAAAARAGGRRKRCRDRSCRRRSRRGDGGKRGRGPVRRRATALKVGLATVVVAGGIGAGVAIDHHDGGHRASGSPHAVAHAPAPAHGGSKVDRVEPSPSPSLPRRPSPRSATIIPVRDRSTESHRHHGSGSEGPEHEVEPAVTAASTLVDDPTPSRARRAAAAPGQVRGARAAADRGPHARGGGHGSGGHSDDADSGDGGGSGDDHSGDGSGSGGGDDGARHSGSDPVIRNPPPAATNPPAAMSPTTTTPKPSPNPRRSNPRPSKTSPPNRRPRRPRAFVVLR